MKLFDKIKMSGQPISETSLERLNTVLLDQSLFQTMPPLFFRYYKSILTPKRLQKYFRVMLTISSLLRVRNKSILDLGCGFGLNLIFFSLLGCKKGVGVDISEESIKGAKILLKKFSPPLNVTVHQEDCLEFECEPMDIIYVQEAMSHIRDTRLLLDRIETILKPGGLLFINDGNNELFFIMRYRARKIWKRSEEGPLDPSLAQKESDKLPFYLARVNIIKTMYPELEMDIIRKLASETKGLYGYQINKAVYEFLSTGKLKQKAVFSYRNPYTGEYPEMTLNPIHLKQELEKRGFKCNLISPSYPFWPLFGDNSLDNAFIKIFRIGYGLLPESFLPFTYPSFQILASKPISTTIYK